MRDSEKKLNNKGSKKSSPLKVRKKGQGKKEKVKVGSKSHTKNAGTDISRKRVISSLKVKGPRKDSSDKKLITGKKLPMKNKKSSQKSSSKLQGKKASLSSRKEGGDADGAVKLQKMKRKRKKKRPRNNVDLDDPSRLQRRTRYLLIKMKLEQNLIDAYSGEGWKGQSREKIRPEKELQRARKQILKCRLGIRDAIRQLDSLGSLSSIEDSAIALDGSVCHEHILCVKCKVHEELPDNDIILCNGKCERAFHQKCLDPPLDTENISPGEQGWFCKFCECKMEILEATNAHLGTHFSLHSTWQDVFKEEAAIPDGEIALLNPEQEWPSDDSEDDDYDPERKEDSHNINIEGTNDSASEDLSSSTSLCSSDGECSPIDGVSHEYFSVNSSIDSDESEDKACGRRQRKAVDYKKLYDEMFGKDAPAYELLSEDEDWGPGKRKRREKESDAVDSLMTLHESENRHPNNEHNMTSKDSSSIKIKRHCFRIPRDAVERLRQVFAENELPPRSIREGLSKELGLDTEKVSKWFKNARYLALKNRKHQAEGVADQLQSITSTKNRLQKQENVDPLKSKTSKITRTHSQKDVKNVNGRKKMKSSNKKRQPEIPPPPGENGMKDFMEISDDVSLKKLLKKRKKRLINFTFGGDSQLAELEFERLSELKTKVDSMKQKLTAIQNYRVKGSPYSNEPSIVYVPTAVLREKVE
ncbi:pathogenesis-related homeodomain protein-like [Glycine soja]|uniref:Pathogenesis-related homeodomain protein isoform A n=1 Tax=Glycine soja TaxID=3848 RepID=A0A445HDT2_GLYSO|nr:pathogenesis-related homeodomain protein-like [Glycine soja]XP_028195654.1 pathogenesis-related homeodomain protein-like [Glycine soja]RZB71748.1 Pathogenesis-related homeodomain protein isoform A [Glycine soja]RZB71749.1 Pathogenesis-related homeodomain protein isoform B [Glycine soja]